jgi:putative aminopeptidase FrvX
VPVIVIGLAVRYIHTHYGFAAYTDVENAVKLGVAVIERLNAERIALF